MRIIIILLGCVDSKNALFHTTAMKMSALSTAAAVCLTVVAAAGLRGAPELHGDGLEYTIQIQAITRHGRLSIPLEKITAYWQTGNPYGRMPPSHDRPTAAFLDQAVGFGGLFRDRSGEYRYYHFWAYSLAAAPLYFLFHILDPAGFWEHYSFRLLNLGLLLLPFLLAWRRRPSWPLLILSGLLLGATPLLPYVNWQHPELFCFGLANLAFFSAGSKRAWWMGPSALGLAAAQNPPLALFFPLHLAVLRRTFDLKLAASYAAGLLIAAAPATYFKSHFGVLNLIQATGQASLGYAGLRRLISLFIDPFSGAIWFFTAVFVFLPPAMKRAGAAAAAFLCLTTAAAAYLTTSTSNFNGGQIGASRYMVWLLAPSVFFLLDAPWPAILAGRRLRFALAAAVVLASMLYFGTWRLPLKHIGRFGPTARAVPEVARLIAWFPPRLFEAETLAENIIGRELTAPYSFTTIAVWNYAPGKSLWLLPRRALERLTFFIWPISHPPSYRTAPGNDLLSAGSGGTRLLPGQARRYLRQPRYGDYIVAKVDRPVRRVLTDAQIRVKGEAISRPRP